MDRRQRKTRTAIFQAFTDLLAHHPYHRITVQHIISHANIGRSTFYAHFETKEYLLSALCDDLFAHVFTDPHPACDVPQLHWGIHPIHDTFVHILHHLTHRKEAFIRLLQSDAGDILLHYFKTRLQTHINIPYQDALAPADYLRNHVVSSFVETVHWWIRNGMKESPDTIAHYFFSMMPPDCFPDIPAPEPHKNNDK